MIGPRAFLFVLALVGTGTAGAQPPAAPGEQPPPAPAPPTDPQAPPSPPPNYSYNPAGRRDPFQSLIVSRGVAEARPGATGRRPEGVAGLSVNEIVVRGILQSQGVFLAMVQAPNGRTYTVRPGDQLLDGRIRAITPEALVIVQEVSDPLSLEKQREVRKPLRGVQERN